MIQSHVILMAIRSIPSVCYYYKIDSHCTPSQQRQALSDANSCEPSPMLINLQDYLSSINKVIQVIPEYKRVSRCKGFVSLTPKDA